MSYREHYDDAALLVDTLFGDAEPDEMLALAYALLNKVPQGTVTWASYDEEDVRQAISDNGYYLEIEAHEQKYGDAIDKIVKHVMESGSWRYGDLHNGETTLYDLVDTAVWELDYNELPADEHEEDEND